MPQIVQPRRRDSGFTGDALERARRRHRGNAATNFVCEDRAIGVLVEAAVCEAFAGLQGPLRPQSVVCYARERQRARAPRFGRFEGDTATSLRERATYSERAAFGVVVGPREAAELAAIAPPSRGRAPEWLPSGAARGFEQPPYFVPSERLSVGALYAGPRDGLARISADELHAKREAHGAVEESVKAW